MPIPSADYALRDLGTDTPPDDAPSASDRGRPQLVANLTAIKGTPGVWYAVATYRTPKGAFTALKACEEDKQPMPGSFYLKARKFKHEDGKTGSELLAMFPGDEEV